MGLFSFIGNIAKSIAHTVSNVVHAVTHTVGSAVNAIGKGLGSAVSVIGKGIEEGLSATGNAIASAAQAISPYLLQAAGVAAIALGVPAPIVMTAEQALGQLQSGNLQGAIGTITGNLNLGSGISGNTLSNVVGNILGTVQTNTNLSNNYTTQLVSNVTQLLNEGFKPISDVFDKIASQTAENKRMADKHDDVNVRIATEILGPSIITGTKEPLTNIHETLATFVTENKVEISAEKKIKLSRSDAFTDIEKEFESFKEWILSEKGLMASINKSLFYLAKFTLALGSQVVPFVKSIEQDANALTPVNMLDNLTMVDSVIKGVISKDDAIEECKRNGLAPERFQILLECADKLLDPQSLVLALNKGIIDNETFNAEMARLSFNPDRSRILKELNDYIPTISDSIRWFQRSIIDENTLDNILTSNGVNLKDIQALKEDSLHPITIGSYITAYPRIIARDKGLFPETYPQKAPNDIREIYRQNLTDPNQADIDWLAHWRDLTAIDFIRGYVLRLITHDEMQIGITALGYPLESIDLLLELNRPRIGIRQITELLETGNMTEVEANEKLSELGYTDDDIMYLIRYMQSIRYGSIAKTADYLLQLSIGQLEQMFKDDILTEEQFEQSLIHHAYQPEAAKLIVELWTYNKHISHRKDVAADIIAQFKLGEINITQAIDSLHNQGFSQGEVDRYQAEMIRGKAANSKLPSEAIILKLLKSKRIGYMMALNMLMANGYSEFWSAMMILGELNEQPEDASIRELIESTTGISLEGIPVPTEQAATRAIETGIPTYQAKPVTI